MGAGDGGASGTEVTTYGRGTDQRLWVSTQISSGQSGFSPVDNNTFADNPGALGVGNRINVSELSASSVGVTNFASSP